jgi:hypothetical protein
MSEDGASPIGSPRPKPARSIQNIPSKVQLHPLIGRTRRLIEVRMATVRAKDRFPPVEAIRGPSRSSTALDPEATAQTVKGFRTFALPLENRDTRTAPTFSSGPDPLRLHRANSVRNERTQITARAAALREEASARQGRGELGYTL